MTTATDGGKDFERDEDASRFRVAEVLALWWSERVYLVRVALIGLVAAGGVGLLCLVMQPVRQQSSLTFRLLFDGAAKGVYPGGSRFTPADIVATPILQEVYRRNGLAKFCEFEIFKNALAVTNLNPSLERLRREYNTRLQDRRLTPADRSRIEAEFESRARAQQNGEFTLVLDIEGAFHRWPETLAGKVLDDVLAVWAEKSRSQGVFRFDLNIFSENILSQIDPDIDDYPILIDRIRVTTDRMLANLRELSGVPGARLLRVGDRQISLGELEVLLQNDLKYRLSMIEAPVYSLGLARERMISEAYVREELFRLQRDSQSLRSQISGAQQAMTNYSASRSGGQAASADGVGSPSGDSFIDRILELSTQETDIAFRQDLVRNLLRLNQDLAGLEDERQIYEKMQRAMATGGSDVQAQRKELEPWIQAQIKDMLAGLRRTLGYVKLLHGEVSQRNLQPSLIYTTIDPLEQRFISTFGLKAMALGIGFFWLACLAVAMGVLAWRGRDSGPPAGE